MIKFFYFFILVTLLSCGRSEPSGDLLKDNIDYWVEIGNAAEQYMDKNWLSAENRKSLVSDLLSKAKNRELPVFYYMDDTLMYMEDEYLQYLFHHVDTEYVQVNEDYKVITYEENLDADAIVRLKFREKWYWDESKNEFSKKVIAICPMIERYKNANEILGYTGLFWIYLDPEFKSIKQ